MPAGVLGVIYILRGETCRSTATQNAEQSVRPQAVPTTRLPTAFYFFNSRPRKCTRRALEPARAGKVSSKLQLVRCPRMAEKWGSKMSNVMWRLTTPCLICKERTRAHPSQPGGGKSEIFADQRGSSAIGSISRSDEVSMTETHSRGRNVGAE